MAAVLSFCVWTSPDGRPRCNVGCALCYPPVRYSFSLYLFSDGMWLHGCRSDVHDHGFCDDRLHHVAGAFHCHHLPVCLQVHSKRTQKYHHVNRGMGSVSISVVWSPDGGKDQQTILPRFLVLRELCLRQSYRPGLCFPVCCGGSSHLDHHAGHKCHPDGSHH